MLPLRRSSPPCSGSLSAEVPAPGRATGDRAPRRRHPLGGGAQTLPPKVSAMRVYLACQPGSRFSDPPSSGRSGTASAPHVTPRACVSSGKGAFTHWSPSIRPHSPPTHTLCCSATRAGGWDLPPAGGSGFRFASTILGWISATLLLGRGDRKEISPTYACSAWPLWASERTQARRSNWPRRRPPPPSVPRAAEEPG